MGVGELHTVEVRSDDTICVGRDSYFNSGHPTTVVKGDRLAAKLWSMIASVLVQASFGSCGCSGNSISTVVTEIAVV